MSKKRNEAHESLFNSDPLKFEPFVRMAASILVDSRIKELSDYKVYSLVSFLCWVNDESEEYSRTGWVKISKLWMATKLRIDRDTVAASLDRLIKNGLIEMSGRSIRLAPLLSIEHAIAVTLQREARRFGRKRA